MATTNDINSIAVATVSTAESAAVANIAAEPVPKIIRADVSAIAAAAVATAVSNAVTATVAAAASAKVSAALAAAPTASAIPPTDPRFSPPLTTSTNKGGYSQTNNSGRKESAVQKDLSLTKPPQPEKGLKPGDDHHDVDGPPLQSTRDIEPADREPEEEKQRCDGDKEPSRAESSSRGITPDESNSSIAINGDNDFGTPTVVVSPLASRDGRTAEDGEAKREGGEEGRVVYSGGPDDGATVWVAGKREAAVIQVRFWGTDIFQWH